MDLNLGPLSNLGDLDTMQNLEEFNLDLLDDDVTTENEVRPIRIFYPLRIQLL